VSPARRDFEVRNATFFGPGFARCFQPRGFRGPLFYGGGAWFSRDNSLFDLLHKGSLDLDSFCLLLRGGRPPPHPSGGGWVWGHLGHWSASIHCRFQGIGVRGKGLREKRATKTEWAGAGGDLSWGPARAPPGLPGENRMSSWEYGGITSDGGEEACWSGGFPIEEGQEKTGFSGAGVDRGPKGVKRSGSTSFQRKRKGKGEARYPSGEMGGAKTRGGFREWEQVGVEKLRGGKRDDGGDTLREFGESFGETRGTKLVWNTGDRLAGVGKPGAFSKKGLSCRFFASNTKGIKGSVPRGGSSRGETPREFLSPLRESKYQFILPVGEVKSGGGGIFPGAP